MRLKKHHKEALGQFNSALTYCLEKWQLAGEISGLSLSSPGGQGKKWHVKNREFITVKTATMTQCLDYIFSEALKKDKNKIFGK